MAAPNRSAATATAASRTATPSSFVRVRSAARSSSSRTRPTSSLPGLGLSGSWNRPASPRVAVYPHKGPSQWLKRLEGERIHRSEAIELRVIDRALIAVMAARLDRRLTFALAVSEGELFVSTSAGTASGRLMREVLA